MTSAGRAPRVVFRPVASGEVVVDGHDSPTRSRLRSHYDDAAAIEMESAGAAEAAYLNGAVPILTVRAISDHASGQKSSTDTAGWQGIAAANAATFACALIAAL
jgi:nucleoside phosphorylase